MSSGCVEDAILKAICPGEFQPVMRWTGAAFEGVFEKKGDKIKKSFPTASKCHGWLVEMAAAAHTGKAGHAALVAWLLASLKLSICVRMCMEHSKWGL